jgi:hypothetical protein
VLDYLHYTIEASRERKVFPNEVFHPFFVASKRAALAFILNLTFFSPVVCSFWIIGVEDPVPFWAGVPFSLLIDVS